MSLLDMFAAQAGPVSQPLVQTPSTPGERFSAEFDVSFAPDRWFNLTGARRDEHQKVIDALHTATGQTFANPYGVAPYEDVTRAGGKQALIDERKQKIRDARNALLQDAGVGQDAIPDPDMIDRQIGEQGDALRRRAGSLVNTGNGLSAFAGGALAPTPENIAGFLIPPAKAVFGATTVARSFLSQVAREAAYQGVTQGALTAASEGLDVLSRSQTGTAQTAGEMVGNIAMGVAAGAVLGGAFHTLHAGLKALWDRWNRLPEQVREKAPLDVRDAMKVLETESIYGEANRLGLPWVMHERYQNAANDPILRGRAVQLEDIRPVDTPMTALATILRQTPDRIEIDGLPRAAARVAALPDAELEPFARQVKPSSFKPLDDVNAQIRALDQRAEAIQQEADQIGVADVADPDTAAILRDIEEKLQRPALRKAEREQLLHERRQWIETLDVRGGLTEALRQGRRDVFPEHLPQLREIAAERAKLEKELAIARVEAQREIDFLRSKLDKIETGQSDAPVTRETFGGEPADIAKALDAAEFDRMIRTVRENVPGGERPSAAPATRAPVPKPTETGLAPEQMEATKAAADAVLETKGSLGDFKRTANRELEAVEMELADARAAAACVANGGGIP